MVVFFLSLDVHAGRAPIHYLAMKNHWKSVESIAVAGGNVDIMDNKLRRPIWYAVTFNRPDAVKALLRLNCCVHPPESGIYFINGARSMNLRYGMCQDSYIHRHRN